MNEATEAPPQRAAAHRDVLGGPQLVGVATAAIALMVGVILLVGGFDEEAIRQTIRATARTSLAFFLLAFTARRLRTLWRHPFTGWQLRNRRYLGLSFAASHTIHLAGILTLAVVYTDSFFAYTDWVTIVFGGIVGYGLIFAMAATSNDASVRRLGRERWRKLHLVGSYYLWFIFFQSYLGSALTHNAAGGLVTLLLAAALGLRLAPQARVARRAAA